MFPRAVPQEGRVRGNRSAQLLQPGRCAGAARRLHVGEEFPGAKPLSCQVEAPLAITCQGSLLGVSLLTNGKRRSVFGEAVWQTTLVLASPSAFYALEALYYPHICLVWHSFPGEGDILEMDR